MLKHGHVVWVGVGGRTNASGVEQLRTALAGHRVEVVPVPVTKVLHLKSAVTALPDGTRHRLSARSSTTRRCGPSSSPCQRSRAPTSCCSAAVVLMSAAAPRTAQLLAARGHDVTTVDISEFEKLEGCVTCLSVRLRG